MTARSELAELAGRWRDDLAAWAIPDHILSAVSVSPWTQSAALFAHRADAALHAPRGPSHERALEALPPGGAVLDVGAGAGAAGLPLAAARRGSLIAVDLSADMLDELADRAAALGVRSHCVRGRWPEVAGPPCTADVAVCKDVIYNVPELPAFFAALTDHARHRVVVELTERHPLAPLNPLWLDLHGLRRPDRPVAGDAYAIAAAMGLRPKSVRWTRTTHGPYGTFDDLVEVVRTRLCLPAARAPDVAAALRSLDADPAEPYLPGTRDRPAMTLWWPGRADRPRG
ncbi:MAG TPA: class I SAM-dependent methyltransferase [Streptosporangiaceae bacterium]|nr:class I SAM-dependent methyltransferase [Streptosporangiaceae bacterium]